MAKYIAESTESSFSHMGSYKSYYTFETLNEKARANIPKYSVVSNFTIRYYVKETSNKVGSADFQVYFSKDNTDWISSVGYLYDGNGVIPKKNSNYLEVPIDLTSYVTLNGADAGRISHASCNRITHEVMSSFLSRDYMWKNVRTYEYTPPSFTINTVAGTGGTVTNTATYDVTIADQTKQITATPNTGYKFVKWVDSNGKTYTDKTISVTISQSSISAHSTTVTYTAYFEPESNIYRGTTRQLFYRGNKRIPVYRGNKKVCE